MAQKTKGKRGLAFTASELESLAESVEDFVPISHTDWDKIRDDHSKYFPEQNRTTDSLRRKFQWMAKLKIPTGDPNMPRHIRVAKRAYYAIVKASDGSTGSPVRDVFLEHEGEGEEDSLDDDSEEEEGDDGGDTGVVLVEPTNITNIFENLNELEDDVDGPVGVDGPVDGRGGRVATTATTTAIATASTAASSVTMMSNGGGGKRSGASTGGGGKKKKSSAFCQPLRNPRRSPSSKASDDGEGGDGWSFGNMMHMMMMQNKMDNDRREEQNKIREEQNKIEADQREREYQLRREEMAIAREEAREQRQLMNLMFMTMLNKNGGTDNSNPAPPSPSPGN
jgi:hypothetical protein